MLKVVDNFTEGRPYREFFIGLIGTYIVVPVLFVIIIYMLFFIGFMRADTGLDLTKNFPVLHAILHFWSEVTVQLALLVATMIGSMFQYYVSRRTIDVLPRSWFYATAAALVLGLVLNVPTLYSFALSQTVLPDPLSRSGMLTGIPLSMMPLITTFFLIAVAQGASLVRYGVVNAILWSLASIGLLLVLLALDKVPAYPLLQGLLAAAMCYRYWTQKDPLKRHAD